MRDLAGMGTAFWRKNCILFLILGCTFLLYSKSIGNGFVNLDDPLLVTENPIVTNPSWHSVFRAFTSYDPELYIPATLLTYQAEAWMLGMHSWHFHLFSLLLHLACIPLIFSISRTLTKSRRIALIVAVLAAIHPINSEAVLWISGRKDLLSAFFFLLSWRLFLDANTWRRHAYLVSILAFTLALLSKISVITLPAVLLLSLWHLRLPIGKKELVRITPYVILAFIFGIIGLFGKTAILGREDSVTFVAMAFRSAAFYLQILVVPAGLNVMHQLIEEPTYLFALFSGLSFALIALISIVAWMKRDSMRIIATGWLFYLMTLAPTFLHYTRGNGEIILGSERYAYVASIGIFLIAATYAVRIFDHPNITRLTRSFLLCAAATLIILYATIDMRRIDVFKNSIAFNDDIINHTFGIAKAHFNLAIALEEAKEPQNADDEYAIAMELDPTMANAAIRRGILYLKEGRTHDALTMFHAGTEMRPDYFKPFYSLGVAYLSLGRYAEAATAFEKTISLFPDYPEAHLHLATTYGKLKRFSDALEQYRILSTLDPSFRQRAEEALQKTKI